MYCLISHSKPDCSDGGATLFLVGADHGYCEKEKRTRQNNLQSATVSLQVVIGLCKRKETAALKSNRRFFVGMTICLLNDGFFLLPSSGNSRIISQTVLILSYPQKPTFQCCRPCHEQHSSKRHHSHLCHKKCNAPCRKGYR